MGNWKTRIEVNIRGRAKPVNQTKNIQHTTTRYIVHALGSMSHFRNSIRAHERHCSSSSSRGRGGCRRRMLFTMSVLSCGGGGIPYDIQRRRDGVRYFLEFLYRIKSIMSLQSGSKDIIMKI